MADNFRKFSELIDNITAGERAWIREVLNCGSDLMAVLKTAGINTKAVEPEWWPGFEWELREIDGDLWLYSEESGCMEHVAEFVRAFLANFRPKSCWSLTWADTCSNPRIGEFSGGGMFVTATRIRFFMPIDDISWARNRFEKRTRRQRSTDSN
jgi:hypothetical protein